MNLAVNIVYIVICVALIVIVLLQSGRQAGLSGSIAGGAETFFGKNKAKGMEAKLALITKICAIVFVVLSIVMMFLG